MHIESNETSRKDIYYKTTLYCNVDDDDDVDEDGNYVDDDCRL